MGNPTNEALEGAGRLGSWVKAELPDVPIEVQPAIVFINAKAQLQVSEPTVPVMDAASLKKWLRGSGKGANLKSADYKALETLFGARAESASR